MPPPLPSLRRAGFTLVELLLALSVGVLVAAVVGALLHGLTVSGQRQQERIRGPFAARTALRTISREIACAFEPPGTNTAPFLLTLSTEPAKPLVRLAFYTPIPSPGGQEGAYDLHLVGYEVHRVGRRNRELRRLASPCAGPFTNDITTQILLSGPFELGIGIVSNEIQHTEWPPADGSGKGLPASVVLSLSWESAPPMQAEVVVQSAAVIRSPVERPPSEPPPGEE